MQNIPLLKRQTLLLVEDDEELICNLADTLAIFFKNIITAKDGYEALEVYKNNTIDIVITDYVMPKMDGNELCKKIRETDAKIPLIIMSSHSDRDKLLKSIDLGLSSYLIKPIEYEQLMGALSKVAQKLELESSFEFILDSDLKYNFSTKELYDSTKESFIKLSKSEIAILELLIHNVNKVVDTTQIEFTLSTNDHKSEQAIKNIIHRLRAKLLKDIISNISKVGYILKKAKDD